MSAAPFVVGQWVRGDRFYGRAELIGEILDGPRNWIWVLGTRRVGKTSLLKQIELLTATGQAPGFFPVFWDFQGADDVDELHQGFQESLLDAEERLASAGIRVEEVAAPDLFRSLGALRRRLRSMGLRLLLLCDEVEELLKLHRRHPRLLPKLRRALQSREDIRTVMASTIRLWGLADQSGVTSPFLHGFTPPLYMNRLDRSEAEQLILQSQNPGDSPRFDDRAVELIRNQCDDHPYLIQLVCKRFCELGDLEESIEQVAVDPMVSHFFAEDFRMLCEAEQRILRLVAEGSTSDSSTIGKRLGFSTEQLGAYLHRLEHLGYLWRGADRSLELVNYFFRRWFRDDSSRGAEPSSAGPESGSDPGVSSAVRLGNIGDWRELAQLVDEDVTEVLGEREPASVATLLDGFDGRYRLVELIGSGATGRVYKALDQLLRKTIAIKILRSGYAAHPEAFERFRTEVLLARDLRHPNVLRIYHLGDCAGRIYLTMQWVGERTLASHMAAASPLPLQQGVGIASKMASALEAAHARRIVHRDIKPTNILLDARGEPFLADFGLARLIDAPARTTPGAFLGTPDYASPEQARCLPTDERSDIYALGVVLFEMVTGQRPFRAASVAEMLERHRSTPPPDPRSLRPGVPDALVDVIRRCLAKDPSGRFPDAGELRAALQAVWS